jgi:hypothetical protein
VSRHDKVELDPVDIDTGAPRSVSRTVLGRCAGCSGGVLSIVVGVGVMPRTHAESANNDGDGDGDADHLLDVGISLRRRYGTKPLEDVGIARRTGAIFVVVRRQQHQRGRESCGGGLWRRHESSSFGCGCAGIPDRDDQGRL